MSSYEYFNGDCICITLKSEDFSYDLTAGVRVPDFVEEWIQINFNSENNITKIIHHNDFGNEIDFKNKKELAEYLLNNWEDETEPVDGIIEILNELN